MDKPRISAVICTYNRAAYLKGAIKSLIDQTLPDKDYEILVVDNASTDETKEVVSSEFSHIKNLRYLHEPIRGIARARNTGWENARGDYISYLDDDTCASRNWLEEITKFFDKGKDRIGCLGGRITPVWEKPRPGWLTRDIEFYVSVLNCSDKVIPINERGIFLSSCNMAIPRVRLEEIGGFNVKFGKRGKELFLGEDTVLQMDLKGKGYVSYYHPGIAVKHHIIPERLKKRYFAHWAFRYGVSRGRMLIYSKSLQVSGRLREIASIIKKIILLSGRSLVAKIGGEAGIFAMLCRIIEEIGRIAGLTGIRK